MMKRILPALLLAVVASSARAQRALGQERIEVLAGVNVAKFANGGDDSDSRVAFVGGLGLIKPLRPNWEFQPELTFSMKGAKGGNATTKLNYLEIPALFRYNVPTSSSAGMHFLVGPAFAFKTSCRTRTPIAGAPGPYVVDDCGDVFNTFDLGVMLGAGVAFRQAGHTVGVGLRYNFGLLDVADGGDAKNRTLSLVASLELPFGR